MAATYDDAVDELHQAPHGAFVAERKRLAGELKAAGDKTGAARLAKLPRPPISAWAVNQLWWHARDAFEAMLVTAERVRDGDLHAAPAHRDAITKLRTRAAAILADAGHGASESTLRRVATTLSAIAATGSFDPDRPGTLGEDRDPPGFETMGIGIASAPDRELDGETTRAAVAPPTGKPAPDAEAEADARAREHERTRRQAAEERQAAKQREADEARARAEAAAERRRAEQEQARRTAERHRLEAAIRTALGEVERRERDLRRLQDAVADAEDKLAKSRAIASELESQLASLT